MSSTFTTLWTNDHIRALTRHGQAGTILDLLLGGPHQSQPSFLRAGVQPGDWVYPIRVKDGALYLLARMRVKHIYTSEEYFAVHPELFTGQVVPGFPLLTVQAYFQNHPAKGYLAHSCTTEVVEGDEGTPIRLDRVVPAEMVEQIRYRSQRKERPIKHLVDGRITRIISLHGIYRLSNSTAEMFHKMFEDT